MAEPILRVDGLVKRFGGLLAVNQVSLDCGTLRIPPIRGAMPRLERITASYSSEGRWSVLNCPSFSSDR